MKKLFVMVLIACICLAVCSKESKDSSGDDRVESSESSVKQDSTDYKVKADQLVTEDNVLISCYEYPVMESVVLYGKPVVKKEVELEKDKSDEMKAILSGLHWEDKNAPAETDYLNGEEWYDLELGFASDEMYYVSLGSGVIQRVVKGANYYISNLTDELWNYFSVVDPERAEGLELDGEGRLTEKGCEQYAKTVLKKIITKTPDFKEWLNLGDGEDASMHLKVEYRADENMAYISVYKENSSSGLSFLVNINRISIYRADKYEENVVPE